MNSQEMINVSHITKKYKLYNKPTDRLKEALLPFKKSYFKEFYALNDVSLSINKGETVGIIGKNGSGKSTLLKILTGVLTSDSGKVDINGKVSALLELGTGFNQEYTGIRNVYMNGTLMGFTKEEMDKKIDDIIKFADIGDYIYQPVKTYSSGMFVRLAFAVAINVDPDILIIDEALAVGDTRFQLKCMDKFLEFKDKGISIIFVSHDINAIKRFCDRSIWINEGKIEADGDTDTVTDQYLDYLKLLDTDIPTSSEDKADCLSDEKNNLENNENDIAGIIDVVLTDENGKEIKNIVHGQKVKATISYYVNDESIKKPVLGLSISRIDNMYICGVNTLLDGIEIPWKKGTNKFCLEYQSFDLVGGSYYFDVALFDQTATVPFDYRAKYKEFFVEMPYTGEGIVILQHKWNKEGN